MAKEEKIAFILEQVMPALCLPVHAVTRMPYRRLTLRVWIALSSHYIWVTRGPMLKDIVPRGTGAAVFSTEGLRASSDPDQEGVCACVHTAA